MLILRSRERQLITSHHSTRRAEHGQIALDSSSLAASGPRPAFHVRVPPTTPRPMVNGAIYSTSDVPDGVKRRKLLKQKALDLNSQRWKGKWRKNAYVSVQCHSCSWMISRHHAGLENELRPGFGLTVLYFFLFLNCWNFGSKLIL